MAENLAHEKSKSLSGDLKDEARRNPVSESPEVLTGAPGAVLSRRAE